MTGDYFRIAQTGKIIKIVAVDECDGIVEYFDGDAGGVLTIGVDKIEPIPITAEILEKNGWRNVVFDEETPVMQIETRCDAFWWDSIKGECGCEMSICDNGEECIEKTFFCKGICYVHELQHALRLCGIDKEIAL